MSTLLRTIEVIAALAATLIVVGWTTYASIALDSYHVTRFADGITTSESYTEWERDRLGAIKGIVVMASIPACGLVMAVAHSTRRFPDGKHGILGFAFLGTFISAVGFLSVGVVLAIPTLLLWLSWCIAAITDRREAMRPDVGQYLPPQPN
ncbi:MAG TPA: hypothetical protein VG845_02080 [Dehalococcoidia bacterium]|nr:hypothetical protein [Dehalococcoidia bacterium]